MKKSTLAAAGLCLLFLFLAPTPEPAAQSRGQGAAAADRLVEEAERLAAEGTRESLVAAVGKLTAAAGLYRDSGDRAREAQALNSAGYNYSQLGEHEPALEHFTRALALYRALGDKPMEAVLLNNLGSVYRDAGELQQALDHFGQALPLLRAGRDREAEAVALNNLGRLYFTLGETRKALEYFDLALPLQRAAGDRAGEAVTLTNAGQIYAASGEWRGAISHYERALPLFRAAGNRRDEAMTLNYLGMAHAGLDEMEKAIEYYQQAMPIARDLGDRATEALILSNVASGFVGLGEPGEAVETYERALRLFEESGNREMAATALMNIAFSERTRGRLPAAVSRMEEALEIVEFLRASLGNQELRSSYFASVRDFYEFYIELLMHAHRQQPGGGHDAKALHASERARARSLLEMLAEAGADIRQGADPALLGRERALRQRINETALAQTRLAGGTRGGSEQAAVGRALEELTAELSDVQAQIRLKSPRYAALARPEPLTLGEIQKQVLDPDTLLLEYSLGKERSYLWAVTADSVESHELPPREEVEEACRQFYEHLKDAERWAAGARAKGATRELSVTPQAAAASPRAGSPEVARRLARILLGPVAQKLAGKRLLVVADGAIQFVPFAALPAPAADPAGPAAYRPLVADHEVVSLPSASTLAVLRREVSGRAPAGRTMAVLADPVFGPDDVRLGARRVVRPAPAAAAARQRGLKVVTQATADAGVSGPGGAIPRLPGTRKEAEHIAALAPGGPPRRMEGFAANRAAVLDPALGDYRYLHFATHGILNSRHPELSGILLSFYDQQGAAQDGFLRAHEVYNLKLSAELVTLSACQTGLGKEVRGEGLVGLTRGFMYAGAPRVVVSLWNVSDEATAELMTRFYRGIFEGGLRPAKALQAAQAAMSQDARFGAPYFWAAFTLQGEWR